MLPSARLFLLAAFLCAFAFGGDSCLVHGQAAQGVEESGARVASLKDQLEKGLRARRPVESQFVATVAQLVNQEQLSRELVQGSFSWTLKKYRNRKYLVPYFEQILRHRAAKAGNTALDDVPSTFPKLN